MDCLTHDPFMDGGAGIVAGLVLGILILGYYCARGEL
jgi:hypothetical protein